jgi:hypothetical protein
MTGTSHEPSAAVLDADLLLRTVLIDGRVVLEDGELLTLDEAKVRRRVRALAIGPLREAANASPVFY